MKKGKMVGAIALTAALAMGTMPAFATASATGSQDIYADGGSTEVKATVQDVTPSIHATVPLKLVVVFGSTGGSEITGPKADSYKISNAGTADIKLTNAEITDVNSKFSTTVMCAKEGENKYKTYDAENENWSSLDTGDHLMFTFTAGSQTTILTKDHPASASVNTVKDTRYLEGATQWADITIAEKAELGIDLGGVAFFNSTLASGEMTDTLCKIKYTIAAASASTGA